MNTKHCRTSQCFDSASMMCDHENYLATQYYLDQAKTFFSRFKLQEPGKNFAGINLLEFDRGQFSQEYNNELCKMNTGPSTTPRKGQCLDDFYVKPCATPTYNNAIACDQTKCCSQSHQLFSNHTRQGTGTRPQ